MIIRKLEALFGFRIDTSQFKKATSAIDNFADNANTARVFSKGTPVKTVIKEIAQQLKIPSGNAMKQLEALTDKLCRGFTASGHPMDELCRVLRQYGVQSNNLQVLKQGQALDKQAINLTADSGLNGTPEIGSDKKIQVRKY